MRTRKKLTGLLLLLTVLLSLRTVSQGHDEQQQKLAALGFLEGDWIVAVSFRLGAQGPWEESTASSAISRDVGSVVFREDFKGTRRDNPFSSLALLGVNNLTLEYERIFVDSEHGAFLSSVGRMRGDSLVFDREWKYPNGNSVFLRTVYHRITSDEFEVESMRRPDESRPWDVTGRMRYRRRAG